MRGVAWMSLRYGQRAGLLLEAELLVDLGRRDRVLHLGRDARHARRHLGAEVEELGRRAAHVRGELHLVERRLPDDQRRQRDEVVEDDRRDPRLVEDPRVPPHHEGGKRRGPRARRPSRLRGPGGRRSKARRAPYAPDVTTKARRFAQAGRRLIDGRRPGRPSAPSRGAASGPPAPRVEHAPRFVVHATASGVGPPRRGRLRGRARRSRPSGLARRRVAMTAELGQPGQIIDGKYRIIRLLGHGGHGRRLRGREHPHPPQGGHQDAARAASRARPRSSTRFEREAQAAGMVGSEHICEVLDLGVLPDQHALHGDGVPRGRHA